MSTSSREQRDRKLPGLHEILPPTSTYVTHNHTYTAPHLAQSNAGVRSVPTHPRDWQPVGPFTASMTTGLQMVDSRYGGDNANTARLGASETGATAMLPPRPLSQAQSTRGDHFSSYQTSNPESGMVIDDPRRDSTRSLGTSAAGKSDCIGQQHFPGRGLCYVYRDGATCPAVIDGEVVNPMWGTTKAGKARKRLAQACLNCREKKIRCEPRHPRCLQCEKANRECVMPSSQNPSLEQHAVVPANAALPINRASLLQVSPPESLASAQRGSGLQQKRRRSNEFVQAYIRSGGSHDLSMQVDFGEQRGIRRPFSSASDLMSGRDATADEACGLPGPFEVNREESQRLMEIYLSQKVLLYHAWYPPKAFRRWLASQARPKPHENMLLYCMLAFSGLLSKQSSTFTRFCIEKALELTLQSFSVMTVWLSQARLLAAKIEALLGRMNSSFEHMHAAIHVVRYLRLYTEKGCTDIDENVDPDTFSMSAEQIRECKRRTFWCCHLDDTLTATFRGCMCTLSNETIRVRAPLTDETFEAGQCSDTPTLALVRDLRASLVTGPATNIDRLGILVIGICRIMKCTVAFSQASYGLDNAEYKTEYAGFCERTNRELSDWYSLLPDAARRGASEAGRIMYSDDSAVLATSLCLYQLTRMHLARRVRHDCVENAVVAWSIRTAHNSAQDVLEMCNGLRAYGQNLPEGHNLALHFAPSIAWPIFAAIDAVCAGGLLSDLRMLLGGVMSGCTVLQTIGFSWPFARVLSEMAGKRLEDLQTLLYTPHQVPSSITMLGGQGWRFREPLIGDFGIEHDVLFEVNADIFLRVLA